MSGDIPAIGIEARGREIRRGIDELSPVSREKVLRLVEVLRNNPNSSAGEECKECGQQTAIALGNPSTGEVEVWCMAPECHHYHKEQW